MTTILPANIASARIFDKAAPPIKQFETRDLLSDLRYGLIDLPSDIGYVMDTYVGEGNKLIVHVQDAHCDYAAQKAVSRIIKHLNSRYGTALICLEGGSGEYDLSPLARIPDPEMRQKVADFFVSDGLMNGAEYAAVSAPKTFVLRGIEDPELYLKNLKIYRDSGKYRAAVDAYLAELASVIETLKKNIYSGELYELDRKYSDHKNKILPFKDYLRYLLALAEANRVPVKELKDVFLLSQVMDMEEKVDFKKANAERDRFMDDMRARSSRNQVEALLKNTLKFKRGELSQKDYYLYLEDEGKKTGIEAASYPAFGAYVRYISLYNAVDRSMMLRELGELEDKLKKSLCRNERQEKLLTFSRNFTLVAKAFDIQMTKIDYDYYKAHVAGFSTKDLVDFMKEEATAGTIKAKVPEDRVGLDERIREIEKFYDISFERDNVFLANVGREMKETGSKTAVLMTGGFHAENLAELMKKERVSYVTILPKFKDAEGYKSPYFNILSGAGIPLAKMLEDGMEAVSSSTLQVASIWNTLGLRVEGNDTAEGEKRAKNQREIFSDIYQRFASGEDAVVLVMTPTGGKGKLTFHRDKDTGKVTMKARPAEPGDDVIAAVRIDNLDDLGYLPHDMIMDEQLEAAHREGRADKVGADTEIMKSVLSFFRSVGLEAIADDVERRMNDGRMSIYAARGIALFDGHASWRSVHVSADLSPTERAATIVHEIGAYYKQKHEDNKALTDAYKEFARKGVGRENPAAIAMRKDSGQFSGFTPNNVLKKNEAEGRDFAETAGVVDPIKEIIDLYLDPMEDSEIREAMGAIAPEVKADIKRYFLERQLVKDREERWQELISSYMRGGWPKKSVVSRAVLAGMNAAEREAFIEKGGVTQEELSTMTIAQRRAFAEEIAAKETAIEAESKRLFDLYHERAGWPAAAVLPQAQLDGMNESERRAFLDRGGLTLEQLGSRTESQKRAFAMSLASIKARAEAERMAVRAAQRAGSQEAILMAKLIGEGMTPRQADVTLGTSEAVMKTIVADKISGKEARLLRVADEAGGEDVLGLRGATMIAFELDDPELGQIVVKFPRPGIYTAHGPDLMTRARLTHYEQVFGRMTPEEMEALRRPIEDAILPRIEAALTQKLIGEGRPVEEAAKEARRLAPRQAANEAAEQLDAQAKEGIKTAYEKARKKAGKDFAPMVIDLDMALRITNSADRETIKEMLRLSGIPEEDFFDANGNIRIGPGTKIPFAVIQQRVVVLRVIEKRAREMMEETLRKISELEAEKTKMEGGIREKVLRAFKQNADENIERQARIREIEREIQELEKKTREIQRKNLQRTNKLDQLLASIGLKGIRETDVHPETIINNYGFTDFDNPKRPGAELADPENLAGKGTLVGIDPDFWEILMRGPQEYEEGPKLSRLSSEQYPDTQAVIDAWEKQHPDRWAPVPPAFAGMARERLRLALNVLLKKAQVIDNARIEASLNDAETAQDPHVADSQLMGSIEQIMLGDIRTRPVFKDKEGAPAFLSIKDETAEKITRILRDRNIVEPMTENERLLTRSLGRIYEVMMDSSGLAGEPRVTPEQVITRMIRSPAMVDHLILLEKIHELLATDKDMYQFIVSGRTRGEDPKPVLDQKGVREIDEERAQLFTTIVDRVATRMRGPRSPISFGKAVNLVAMDDTEDLAAQAIAEIMRENALEEDETIAIPFRETRSAEPKEFASKNDVREEGSALWVKVSQEDLEIWPMVRVLNEGKGEKFDRDDLEFIAGKAIAEGITMFYPKGLAEFFSDWEVLTIEDNKATAGTVDLEKKRLYISRSVRIAANVSPMIIPLIILSEASRDGRPLEGLAKMLGRGDISDEDAAAMVRGLDEGKSKALRDIRLRAGRGLGVARIEEEMARKGITLTEEEKTLIYENVERERKEEGLLDQFLGGGIRAYEVLNALKGFDETERSLDIIAQALLKMNPGSWVGFADGMAGRAREKYMGSRIMDNLAHEATEIMLASARGKNIFVFHFGMDEHAFVFPETYTGEMVQAFFIEVMEKIKEGSDYELYSIERVGTLGGLAGEMETLALGGREREAGEKRVVVERSGNKTHILVPKEQAANVRDRLEKMNAKRMPIQPFFMPASVVKLDEKQAEDMTGKVRERDVFHELLGQADKMPTKWGVDEVAALNGRERKKIWEKLTDKQKEAVAAAVWRNIGGKGHAEYGTIENMMKTMPPADIVGIGLSGFNKGIVQTDASVKIDVEEEESKDTGVLRHAEAMIAQRDMIKLKMRENVDWLFDRARSNGRVYQYDPSNPATRKYNPVDLYTSYDDRILEEIVFELLTLSPTEIAMLKPEERLFMVRGPPTDITLILLTTDGVMVIKTNMMAHVQGINDKELAADLERKLAGGSHGRAIDTANGAKIFPTKALNSVYSHRTVDEAYIVPHSVLLYREFLKILMTKSRSGRIDLNEDAIKAALMSAKEMADSAVDKTKLMDSEGEPIALASIMYDTSVVTMTRNRALTEEETMEKTKEKIELLQAESYLRDQKFVERAGSVAGMPGREQDLAVRIFGFDPAISAGSWEDRFRTQQEMEGKFAGDEIDRKTQYFEELMEQERTKTKGEEAKENVRKMYASSGGVLADARTLTTPIVVFLQCREESRAGQAAAAKKVARAAAEKYNTTVENILVVPYSGKDDLKSAIDGERVKEMMAKDKAVAVVFSLDGSGIHPGSPEAGGEDVFAGVSYKDMVFHVQENYKDLKKGEVADLLIGPHISLAIGIKEVKLGNADKAFLQKIGMLLKDMSNGRIDLGTADEVGAFLERLLNGEESIPMRIDFEKLHDQIEAEEAAMISL